MRDLFKSTLVILLLSVISLFAKEEKQIWFEAYSSKTELKAGEEFTITLKMTLKNEWYTFSLNEQLNDEGIGPTPTEIIADIKYYEIIKDKFKTPKPGKKYDEGFEVEVEYYDKTTEFVIPVKAIKDINLKKEKLHISVFFQLCTEGKCIPPDEVKVKIGTKTEKSRESNTGKSYRKSIENNELEVVNISYSPVTFIARPSKLQVEANESFTINLEINTARYWYTYSLKEQINDEGIGPTATEISFDDKANISLNGDIRSPKPIIKYDKGFETDIEMYEGTFNFEIPVKAKKKLDFIRDEEFITVYLQMCDTTRCLPPEEYFVYISDSIYETVITSADEIQMTDSQKEIEEKKGEGIFSFLWFAMTMGAIALLTPCVFPMIPITVSFFTKRAEKSPGKGLRDSIIYTLGIITTFTALGFILALILGSTGIQDFATNPWINLFIAAIFIVFALNLFGAFEIQIPTGLLNKLNVKSQGGGIFSVLLMGLTFSLTSFTCTVPFVGSSLVAASSGEWFYPVIGMLGFSAVFAAPFFLLALFPSFMQKLPKSGGWMNNVKVVMGFLEIAAAVKFISNADLVWNWGILPKEVFLAIWIGCAVLITVYILGVFRLSHDSPVTSVSTPRILFAILFTSITVYLWSGMYGKPLGELDAFLPPPEYSSLMGSSSPEIPSSSLSSIASKAASIDNANDAWHKDYQEALSLAKKENKSLFIDFTGFTCTNCRWMETKMFVKPEVEKLLNKYVKVKLFTDRREEPYKSNKKMQMQRFNSIELPLYVILTPDEKLVSTKAFTRDVKEFVSFLQNGLN